MSSHQHPKQEVDFFSGFGAQQKATQMVCLERNGFHKTSIQQPANWQAITMDTLLLMGTAPISPMSSYNMPRTTKSRFYAFLPIPLTSCNVSTLVKHIDSQPETVNSIGCTWFLSIQDCLPEACQWHGF